MRHYRLATTTILLLLLPHKSWSFSPTRHQQQPFVFCSLSATALQQQQQSATTHDNAVAASDATDNTNVLTFSPNHHHHHKASSPSSSVAAWKSLIPLIPGERGCDISIEWSFPEEGSRRLLQHLFPSSNPNMVDQLQPFLEESFQTFSSLATTTPSSHDEKFKARIVATRGPSGTKCPRWHVDHVPLRWIQSLVGPGCDYVLGTRGVNWEAMNNLDDNDDMDDANSKLVNDHIACIHHAPPLQGVVLWGAENDKGLVPAVHKSPSLGFLEGRVLLTLDVLRDN